jgi:hypothetical protein
VVGIAADGTVATFAHVPYSGPRMNEAIAIAAPAAVVESDRWTRRWMALAAVCYLVVAVVPSRMSGAWSPAWDRAWYGGTQYAAYPALALACLFAARARSVPAWFFPLIAVVAAAFYSADWLLSLENALRSWSLRSVRWSQLAENAYCLGIGGVAAGNHLRKAHASSKAPRWIAATGGAVVVAVSIRWAQDLRAGTASSEVLLASLTWEAAAAFYGALGVAALADRGPSTRFISTYLRLLGVLYLARNAFLSIVVPHATDFGGWPLSARVADFLLSIPAHLFAGWIATGVGIAVWVGARLRPDPEQRARSS